MNYEKFKISDRPDRFRSLTLLSTIFSPLLGKSFWASDSNFLLAVISGTAWVHTRFLVGFVLLDH
jgi:hypothetical protein